MTGVFTSVVGTIVAVFVRGVCVSITVVVEAVVADFRGAGADVGVGVVAVSPAYMRGDVFSHRNGFLAEVFLFCDVAVSVEVKVIVASTVGVKSVVGFIVGAGVNLSRGQTVGGIVLRIRGIPTVTCIEAVAISIEVDALEEGIASRQQQRQTETKKGKEPFVHCKTPSPAQPTSVTRSAQP